MKERNLKAAGFEEAVFERHTVWRGKKKKSQKEGRRASWQLVCLGCYNKRPYTVNYKQEIFIFTILKAGCLEIRVPAWSGEGPLPGPFLVLSLCVGRL